MNTLDSGLDDFVVADPPPELRQGDLGFELGKVGTETEVHATTETREFARRTPADLEAVGIVEDVGVSVGRSDQEQDLLPPAGMVRPWYSRSTTEVRATI